MPRKRDCHSSTVVHNRSVTRSFLIRYVIFGRVCRPAGLVEVDHRRVHVGVAGHRLHLRDAGSVANCRADR